MKINNNYLKSSNIVSSNINAVINGTDNLETINNAQSKIIASNRNGVLIGNDHIVTEAFCNNIYLTFNMLKSPTDEKPGLLYGRRWIMTENELINFIDGRAEEEKKIKLGTNNIATTGGLKSWIFSNNREQIVAQTDF